MLYQSTTALLSPLATLQTEVPRTAVESGPDLTRYFLICTFLLLAIAGIAWGFKRLFATSVRKRAAQRSLQILDVLPLGGKQKVAVIRCYDRVFALGMGDKEVSPIAELDAVVAQENPVAEAPPSKADNQLFQRALAHVQAALARSTGAEPAPKTLPVPPPETTAPAARPSAAPRRRKKVRTQTAPQRKVARVAPPVAQAAPQRKVRRTTRPTAGTPATTTGTAPASKRTQTTPQLRKLDGIIG